MSRKRFEGKQSEYGIKKVIFVEMGLRGTSDSSFLIIFSLFCLPQIFVCVCLFSGLGVYVCGEGEGG